MFPIMAGNSASTGYNLTRSLRFRKSASAYLSRTPATTSGNQIFTMSTWVKRGQLGVIQTFSYAYANTNLADGMSFLANDTLQVSFYAGGASPSLEFTTTQVFRDPSAWYHIVFAVDTTQATASNRVKFYVNGSQVTSFATSTTPTQNLTFAYNTNCAHVWGVGNYGSLSNYTDFYTAELNWITGQQLTPSSFGSTNALTGVWQPARYTGTYGTNGFYLPFTDNSALTTSSNVGLGKDFSGNGNYWTTNNISITAGVTYDSMTDVPTLTSATAANFAVLNPLSNGAAVPSGGNLNQGVSGADQRCNSTIFVSSGKWYFEVTLNTAGTNTSVGIGQNNITNQYPGNDILSFVQEIDNARKGNNNTYTAYGTALTAGQVFMCAIDLTNLKLFFGSQGTWFASSDPVTGASPAFTLTAGLYCAISRPYGGSAAISINFGQRPFSYTPPTGFVALNTYNLPTSTIVKGNTVMDAALYTGDGNLTRTLTGLYNFQPDLIWPKNRSSAFSNVLQDSVRGFGSATKLSSDSTAAENIGGAPTDPGVGYISSANSTGFSVATTGGGITQLNQATASYVAWAWKANTSTSSNTNGTITSTVSVNASAGFSVVTWTGTQVAATVGHGLGVAPQFIVVKSRTNGIYGWAVYTSMTGAGNYLLLSATSASAASSTTWNNTSPTSSVFSIGADVGTNKSGDAYVAYCWTPIAGFSAFGSLTGNGSADGPFTYTGFRPKLILFKNASAVASWWIFDTVRNTYNVADLGLRPNTSDAETNFPTFDILSNGFKVRTTDAGLNGSGNTIIYGCWAENPFKNALAR